MYREIRDNPQLRYKVIGFLDDNPSKIGKTIHGRPVLGIIGDLQSISRHYGAEEVLIAIPSARYQEMRRIVAVCRSSQINFKTVPGMGELINGKVTINAIRDVSYQDLLGRETVHLDKQSIGAYLKGQSVMITGAGGSIGSELCRQICTFAPRVIILYERAESPLYEIDLELKKAFPRIDIVPVLSDIKDKNQLKRTFESFHPQTLFHAAAYKHVPMLEIQPWKAIENNVLGTRCLIEVAEEAGLERFVFVSTDKAVRPANVMGTSKRIAEMITLNQNHCTRSNIKFMTVRFGNVVGSVGSVIPLFEKQIKNGGPVTVTHPEVTRFFMTISEACQLILQAGAMGTGGEIFILDMGTPIRIQDMARDLIRLSGFEPDEDIKIEYTGLRPGEKLYEELITEGENIVPTDHKNILVLKGGRCNLSILNGHIQELLDIAAKQDENLLRIKLLEIVPEYVPAQNGFSESASTWRNDKNAPKPDKSGNAF
jgi:FlaA1/EpsC-like NDP-sugar epimerase